MGISEQVLLLAFALTSCYLVIVMQAVALRHILKSSAWTLLALAFIVGGARQVIGYIRLPAAIMKAQQEGVMPESLSVEQWIQVGATFLMLGLIIWGLNLLRKDLRSVGI
ncbi:MAG TPA: hypothetical protein VN256_13075 [Pyrinomonadaceae bacterium]|nr:hypothetical protein [Pyrinomonadaceae bacterium]